MSKISVIVPVHNTEQYLEKCVRSLTSQTLKDIEIILVENASTDGSLSICKSLAAQDERISYVHSDIGDLAAARNLGLTIATSEYVAFVDSDDTVQPDMYETLYTLATENNIDIIYSNYIKVYENRAPRSLYEENGEFFVCETKEILYGHYLQKFPTSVCTMVARKKLFDNIKFPEFQYYEDRATTYRLLASCSRAGYLNKAFYHYFQRGGSIVYTTTWKHFYDYCHAEGERLKFLYKSDMFTDEEKAVMARLSSSWLIRKLRHLRKHSKSFEEKIGFYEMKRYIRYIPRQCKLSLRLKMYRVYFRYFDK